MSHFPKPKLSPSAFWDVDFDKIDFDKNSLFVMNKVFNYGSWGDIVEVLKFYGLERINTEIVQAAYLKKTALSFLCLILELNNTDFVAYQRRRAKPATWQH